jgi:hypothetical protein
MLTSADSVRLLQEKLESKQEDRTRMERMLESLNTVDSVYKASYPTWVIVDADLRERVYKTFQLRGHSVSRDEDVTVVTSPNGREIIEVSMGDSRLGRRDTYTNLSDSLQREILTGDYVRKETEPKVLEPRKPAVFGDQPRYAGVYASAFGAGLMFSNTWGIEGKLGYEELGYHFWSTGSVRASAIINNFKIGIVAPITQGKPVPGEELGPLDLRPRLMTGTKGFVSEFAIPFASEQINLFLSVGDLNSASDFSIMADSTATYYLHTAAQASYSRREEVGTHEFTLVGGLGYHQMAYGEVQPDRSINTTSREDFISPVLRVEYRNRSGSHFYGASLQYYSSIIYLKGWVELIKNLLYIDVQYYSPFLRDPKPWEQPYFVMISPRIQVIY